MPKIGGPLAGKGAFGALGAVRSFFSVVKEIDFEEVRDRAESRPRIIVIGQQEDEARTAAQRVFGSENEPGIEFRGANRSLEFDKNRFDAAIVHDPGNSNLHDDVRRFAGQGWSGNVFELKSTPGATDAEERLRLEMAMSLPHLAPALGRFYPSFRPAATRAIIEETSRVNAKFALVSNVPSVIPILGSFVAASADLIVLTKNQIMMCYKIAAAHDRDLGDQVGVIRELVPVVGAGFLWRTAAREAAAFIPFAAGTIPKVVIAYAGTYSAGRAADFYYRFGKKPSAEQLSAFTKQASEIAKQLPFLSKGEAPSANGTHEDQPTMPIDARSTTKLDKPN